ncbi:hypothetical protein BWQ96_09703 [Gracilariopsis chorda]|uniref:Uncharacterized protein n=1 Tax=Gracilariopsis chorda TaxID=448386 RepID=A0A2V3IET6_9FLOR|nr:hypothetical protein BWQ96_09703 [Gracilariopsis chorda]|eukprot:PXF40599.1 hypothetical protein BWQ96_09703 [Gracilariopsis chorda]
MMCAVSSSDFRRPRAKKALPVPVHGVQHAKYHSVKGAS